MLEDNKYKVVQLMCHNIKLLDDAYGQKTENGRLKLIFGTFGNVYTIFGNPTAANFIYFYVNSHFYYVILLYALF